MEETERRMMIIQELDGKRSKSQRRGAKKKKERDNEVGRRIMQGIGGRRKWGRGSGGLRALGGDDVAKQGRPTGKLVALSEVREDFLESNRNGFPMMKGDWRLSRQSRVPQCNSQCPAISAAACKWR